MAARNNPLINWLNMSFDTFNLLHRWQGRIVVAEAVTHVIAFSLSTTSVSAFWKAVTGNKAEMWGFIVSTHGFLTSSITDSR